VEASIVYLLYAGFKRKRGLLVNAAAATVAAEIAVYAGNGFRCPLTNIAEDLGGESGSITDIYLPHWFAKSLPVIHVPLIALVIRLHTRNRRHERLRPKYGIGASYPGGYRAR